MYRQLTRLSYSARVWLRETKIASGGERIYRQQRDSLCYSPPNTISHCRQTRLSLATNAFCAGPETNTFGAGDERVEKVRSNRPSLRGVRTGFKPIPRFVLVKPDVVVMNNINLSGVT